MATKNHTHAEMFLLEAGFRKKAAVISEGIITNLSSIIALTKHRPPHPKLPHPQLPVETKWHCRGIRSGLQCHSRIQRSPLFAKGS